MDVVSIGQMVLVWVLIRKIINLEEGDFVMVQSTVRTTGPEKKYNKEVSCDAHMRMLLAYLS